MKIAIDLNNVIREYSSNFLKYYLDLYNHELDLSDFEFFSKDMKLVLPFQNDESYYRFVYDNYSFELYGKCPTCGNDTPSDIKKFIRFCSEQGDNEVSIVSTMEYASSIGATYFFISKLNPGVREIYLPKDSTTLWDRYDLIITADPDLIANVPEGKTCIKIDFDYNKDVECEHSYRTFKKLVNDEETLKKILTTDVHN